MAVVDGDSRISFEELSDRSDRLASALLSRSPRPSGCVALLLSNRAEFVEADVAILKAGKVKVAINPWLNDDERRYMLNDCGADVLITEASFAESARALAGQVPSIRHVVVVAGGNSEHWEDYGRVVEGAAPMDQVPVAAADPSVIIYTSGTTGRPKGATWTFEGRLAAMRNMLTDELRIDATDGMIHAGPLSHGSGSKTLTFLLKGARNIVLPRFDPELFISAVERDGGTVSFMVPTMIARLVEHPEMDATRLRGLRQITYGGAPMPRATIERALEVLGPIFVQVYGSSEAPHPVTVLARDDHARGVLSVTGRETLGTEVSLRDPVLGTPVQLDQNGELWVRGDNVMAGYWNNPGATSEVLVDGWYRTGDIAKRDENGYLTIVDRVRDLIITGGMNVYPAEVERVLRSHPSVAEVCVVGLPDDDLGEAVSAFVVTNTPGATTEGELVRYARAELAGYKKPRRVTFVDSLPKGSTGKVLKSALRAKHGRSVEGEA